MNTPNPVAFSYIRFSQASQAKGDSVRRQTELAELGAKQLGVKLDPSTFQDLGVSGFTGEHRNNPDRHGLAMFLLALEKGKVKRGDYLLVENLDRLSREHVMKALGLLLNLVNAGVRVVQLSPSLMVFDENSQPMALMMAVMELSRGNSESAMKAERCGKAWREKKKEAREEGTPTTAMLPAWLELYGGKIVTKPDAAKAVKRVYELCVAGYGHLGICKKLAEEGHAPIGKSGQWVRSYVAHLLTCRQVLGEYQPIVKKTRKPDGNPIPNYYPAVVTEELYHQAQHAKSLRDGTTGRPPTRTNFNYFTGLMCRAGNPEDKYFTQTCVETKKNRRQVNYQSQKANQGVAAASCFPQDVLDRAFFKHFRILQPKDVLGEDTTSEELSAVTGELEAVQTKLAELTAEMETGEVKRLVPLLRKWEEKAEALTTKQNALRQKAAHPKAEAFGETQHLLGGLLWDAKPKKGEPDNSDEMKHRLRACLRRVIDRMHCTFGGTRNRRRAIVQITYHDSTTVNVLLVDFWPQRAHGTAGGGKKVFSEAKTVSTWGTLDRVIDEEEANGLFEKTFKGE